MTKTRRIALSMVAAVLALLVVVTVTVGARSQGAQPEDAMELQGTLGTSFTYQGQLEKNGEPVNHSCEMAFRLYDAGGTGDSQVGIAISTAVPISDGLFAVVLNENAEFGPNPFAGDARWLGISVLCPDDSVYTDLGRQELTASPYAHYALGAPWSGLTGVPGDLADGDDDTTYTAGAGLDLSGGEFSVVTDTVQQRVSETCEVGYSVRAINANGTVVCEPANPRPGFSVTTLDSGGPYSPSSVAIGEDGLPLISYGANGLKVAHCSDVACTSAISTTFDDASTPAYLSIAIGSDGLGLISYYDYGSVRDLKVAHCENPACTSAIITTVDSAGNVGNYSSVTIGTDGLALISYLYHDGINGDLRVAHCNDVACTSAVTSTVEHGGDVGAFTSVTIGSDGLGLISYKDHRDYTNEYLKVAHCDNITCTSATITTLDSAGKVGYFASVTTGSDGLGLISYTDRGGRNLKVAHCDNTTCTSATITTLDSAGLVGDYTAVTIGSDGLGLISYYDATNNDLKAAHCDNLACTSATLAAISDASGAFTSITIGTDGMGLITCWDALDYEYEVVHCSNVFCIPYFRRR